MNKKCDNMRNKNHNWVCGINMGLGRPQREGERERGSYRMKRERWLLMSGEWQCNACGCRDIVGDHVQPNMHIYSIYYRVEWSWNVNCASLSKVLSGCVWVHSESELLGWVEFGRKPSTKQITLSTAVGPTCGTA